LSCHPSLRCSVVVLVSILGLLAISLADRTHHNTRALVVAVDQGVLPANGYATANLHVHDSGGRQAANVRWRFVKGSNLAGLEAANSEARLRAGVTPGTVRLVAGAQGYRPASIEVRLGLDSSDEFGDGTPDFLRLQSEDDQIAFRHWFTFLAESLYVLRVADRPSEVMDCAALIRFAYREALTKHDAFWANHWHLTQLPGFASVLKYDYPHTALGAGLFRIRPGAFAPDDARDGAFAEFADADSLRIYNTYFVSRDLDAARPGDLLFFQQAGHRMPFHTMIYLGQSYFESGSGWLLYHTGPTDGQAGEIRRVTGSELQQHPEFRWRPLAQNPAFLGVYRWNILREEE
jgi:uncharacterized protein